jgi:anti-sigma factor RsiW
MNDDLLMKFIDGTATKEEADLVEAYLSENEDATAELLQMVHASKLAGASPFGQIDRKSAADFVSRHIAKQEKAKVVRLKWILGGSIAVAASAAIILGLFLTVEEPGMKSLPVSIMQKATAAVDSVSVDQAADTLKIEVSHEKE